MANGNWLLDRGKIDRPLWCVSLSCWQYSVTGATPPSCRSSTSTIVLSPFGANKTGCILQLAHEFLHFMEFMLGEAGLVLHGITHAVLEDLLVCQSGKTVG